MDGRVSLMSVARDSSSWAKISSCQELGREGGRGLGGAEIGGATWHVKADSIMGKLSVEEEIVVEGTLAGFNEGDVAFSVARTAIFSEGIPGVGQGGAAAAASLVTRG